MRKLFVLPEADNPYQDELNCARDRVNDDALAVSLSELSVEYLQRKRIDVIVTTGLSAEWYYIFKGMNIVSITLGERERFYDLSDIVIDCRNDNPKHYFVSHEHTICGNPDFDFAEIAELIKKLEWDSEFFGFNVAFLSCMHLTENIYSRIEQFLQSENIRLLEYACNCHDARSVRVAEDRGFRFTDIRLQFMGRVEGSQAVDLPDGVHFGLAGEEHIPHLREIAHGIYADSRYHFDSNFDHDRVVEFYKNWVEKGVRGQFDHQCWCLFEGDTPVAFCTVRYGKADSAIIGLVGMDQRVAGCRLGRRMICSVLNVLVDRGVKTVNVVTQGRNYAAQNLYQSVGFRTKTTQLWYHKWIDR